MSIGGRLTAPACHATKFVNKAQYRTVLSANIDNNLTAQLKLENLDQNNFLVLIFRIGPKMISPDVFFQDDINCNFEEMCNYPSIKKH
jgi:hypothetical protein